MHDWISTIIASFCYDITDPKADRIDISYTWDNPHWRTSGFQRDYQGGDQVNEKRAVSRSLQPPMSASRPHKVYPYTKHTPDSDFSKCCSKNKWTFSTNLRENEKGHKLPFEQFTALVYKRVTHVSLLPRTNTTHEITCPRKCNLLARFGVFIDSHPVE